MKTNTGQTKKFMLSLFVILSPLSANAEKIEFNSIWYNLVSKAKQAEVTYKGDDPYQGGWYSGSITLPTTVTHNGVEYSVTSIGERAFHDCSSLTAITIPEGVTSIGDNAFYGCSSLTSITIPEGVTSIGRVAFGGCSSLTSMVVAEGNTIYDSRNNCNAIIETSSNTLTHGCSATIIPEGVTSIGNYAFLNCRSLTAITIPEGVISIRPQAFSYCRSLTSITCDAATPPTIYSNTFDEVDKSIPVYVPAGSVEAYKAEEYWSEFNNIVPISLDQCATPAISYENGKVKIACETEGAEVKTKLDIENDMAYESLEFDLIPTYTLTAYATKEQYDDSEVATLTLCWIPCDGQHMTTETTSIPSKPVLIQSQGGTITLNGISDDTEVAAYDLAGNTLGEATATGGAATLTTNLAKGDIVIVKIGSNSIKIAIK